MIEVYPNLYVGDQNDYEFNVKYQGGWFVVHACKEPYHRQTLGYRSRGAPKENPEYLIAYRDNRMILNLVDARDPAYIPQEIIDAALGFIHGALEAGHKVLVHCNQGESRSPTIALLYLAHYTDKLCTDSYDAAVTDFVELYPEYRPGTGMQGFAIANWSEYASID